MTNLWHKLFVIFQLVFVSAFTFQCDAAGKAVICDPGNTIFLENPAAVKALKTMLEQSGYQVCELSKPEEWNKALDDRNTALIVYAPCETVPESIAAKIKPFLARGGIIIIGGGMPVWYVVETTGKPIRSGSAVQQEIADIEGGFITEPLAGLTEIGHKIMGDKINIPAGVRGITAVAPGKTLIPFATVGNTYPVVAVSYDNGGKLFYTGSQALDRGAVDPLQSVNIWPALLKFLNTPLPEVAVKVARDEWHEGLDSEVKASFILNNPFRRDMEFSGKAVLIKEPSFGLSQPPQKLWEQKFSLQAGKKLNHEFTFPMPEAKNWGVYRIEFISDSGVKSSTCFHVLPPAAVDYIDVDPIYPANPAEKRKITVGIRAFIPEFPAKIILAAQPMSGGDWKKIGEFQLRLQRSPKTNITVYEFDIVPSGKDLRLRATIADEKGNAIHDSYNRLEIADHNLSVDRKTTMFRALDGRQFTEEDKLLTDDLKSWRKEMPLFRGIQTFALPGNSRQWMLDNDFLCNYGQIITHFPMMQEWKLDDRNGIGISAYQLMPAHDEDVTSWLVRQHSRGIFQPFLDGKPEIINLVEAVAGYETPGIFPNRTGNHSHMLGYTPKAVPNYREALTGRDEGVRMLDLGGKTARRYYFKDMYELTYNEKMPTPKSLGFSSWDNYVPYISTLQNEAGFFKDRQEELKYRIHYFLRSYCHMKQLDDLTANLRAFAPEIHCVIGHDGPLVAQVSSQYYRLPYIDTQTRWLFRSAYIHAIATTYAGERTWLETAGRFGRRVGAHEEIGGGQWAPYRTAETSFVSLFTKRAALPYHDLQVDFYHNRNKTYRVAEEKAMFRGFQLAVDTEAIPCTDQAEILTIHNNNSYYPDNYSGNYRWDLKQPEVKLITLDEFFRNNGIPYHGIETPIWDTKLLSKYRIVCLQAERYMKGDLQNVAAWLNDSSSTGRTLFINHASPLQINFLRGPGIKNIQWNSPREWQKLGLNLGQPIRIEAKGLEFADHPPLRSNIPLTCLMVKPPQGANVLVKNENGNPIVWQYAVGKNSIIYSGLPMNNITANEDPQKVCNQILLSLFSRLKCLPVWKATPENWFACGYRLKGDKLAIALINPAEEQVAMKGPYGDDGDKVEEVAAALGSTEVGFDWYKAGTPGRTYKVRDAWTSKLLPQTVTADSEGNIKTKFKVNTAKLFFLE